MTRFGFYLLLMISLMSAQICLADTGVPSLYESEASIAYSGPDVPSLLVVPDGSGAPFTEARDAVGDIVDATITLHLRDFQGFPIANFPWEDIWLETDAGLVPCSWGIHPDDNTDVNGMTRWTLPAPAGGHSEGPVFVLVNGSRLTSNDGLPLRFTSPDINGDLVVNLADVSLFTYDFYTLNPSRSDFNGDGQLNLADIAHLAQAFSDQCP